MGNSSEFDDVKKCPVCGGKVTPWFEDENPETGDYWFTYQCSDCETTFDYQKFHELEDYQGMIKINTEREQKVTDDGMWIGGWYHQAYLTKHDLDDIDNGKLSLADAYKRCFVPLKTNNKSTIADKVLAPPINCITRQVNKINKKLIEYNRRGKK